MYFSSLFKVFIHLLDYTNIFVLLFCIIFYEIIVNFVKTLLFIFQFIMNYVNFKTPNIKNAIHQIKVDKNYKIFVFNVIYLIIYNKLTTTSHDSPLY